MLHTTDFLNHNKKNEERQNLNSLISSPNIKPNHVSAQYSISNIIVKHSIQIWQKIEFRFLCSKIGVQYWSDWIYFTCTKILHDQCSVLLFIRLFTLLTNNTWLVLIGRNPFRACFLSFLKRKSNFPLFYLTAIVEHIFSICSIRNIVSISFILFHIHL